MFELLSSFTKKKTGSVFPSFCHATFHHTFVNHMLKCIASRVPSVPRDTFDFRSTPCNQESTNGSPCLSESLGI